MNINKIYNYIKNSNNSDFVNIIKCKLDIGEKIDHIIEDMYITKYDLFFDYSHYSKNSFVTFKRNYLDIDIYIDINLHSDLHNYRFFNNDKTKYLQLNSSFDVFEFFHDNNYIVINVADKLAKIIIGKNDEITIRSNVDKILYEPLMKVLLEPSKEVFDLLLIQYDFYPNNKEKETLVSFINLLKELNLNLNKKNNWNI